MGGVPYFSENLFLYLKDALIRKHAREFSRHYPLELKSKIRLNFFCLFEVDFEELCAHVKYDFIELKLFHRRN